MLSALISRTAILIVCRLMGYGMMLLSPIVLVRLLDMRTYGQYREFLLYAMLFLNFLGFGIRSNLLYFIPKDPLKEKFYITNTTIFLLITSTVGIGILLLGHSSLLVKASFDFLWPLIFYLFFFLNLDCWEEYWLSKRRSEYVLYYATIRMFARMTAIVLCAYLTRSVILIIWSMVAVEVIRFIFVLGYLVKTRRLVKRIDRDAVKTQLVFIVPIGLTTVINYFNSQISQLFISIHLGVTFLAIYVIGSYQVPVLNIIKSSVSDVIFPEITQRNDQDLNSGLELWRKANVVYCALIFPLFVVFFFYADIIIKLMFTETYSDAIPIFRVYLILMVRRCFEMSVPIRSLNKNKYFLLVNAAQMVVNVGLLFLLYKIFGIIGPALALVLSDIFQAICLSGLVMRFYKVTITQLLKWRTVFKITLASLLSFPVLLFSEAVTKLGVFSVLLASMVYLIMYAWIMSYFKIEEVNLIWVYCKNKLVKSRNEANI